MLFRSYDNDTRVIGVMYAGRTLDDKKEDIVYIGINAYWENIEVELPKLPDNLTWKLCVDTFSEQCIALDRVLESDYITLGGRSVIVLEAVEK